MKAVRTTYYDFNFLNFLSKERETMKNVLAKILLLLLCFTFAFTGLVACGTEELEQKLDGVQNQINQNDQNDAADAAALAELKALVEEVKATADAAATKTKLEALSAQLSSFIEAAATKEELAAAKTALEAALEAANAAITANGTADANTKAALEAAIAAVDATAKAAATKTELANEKAALQKAIADNATADAATKAELQNKLTAVENAYKAADTALTNQINNVNTTLTNSVNALQTKVNALEKSVNDSVAAINTRLNTLESTATKLTNELAALKLQVEALEKAGALDFVQNYEDATKVLNGDLRVVLANGKIEKLVDETAAEWATATELSLARFETLNHVDATKYAPVEVAKFESKFADLRFFLGRAISVEAILGFFTDLETYKNEMPSLIQTLTDLLTAKTVVTTDPTDLDDIDATANMIVDLATNAEYATVYKWYVEISAAHDNLINAAANTTDAENAITAIGYVTFTASEALIADAKAEIEAFVTTYLSVANFTKYYDVDETDLIANYDVYTAANERYAQLTAANTNKVTIVAEATNYATERPLWTDKEVLDANLEAYKAWLAEYELDETADALTLATIYAANEIELLNKAVVYATAMNTVYTETEFAGLDAAKLTGVAELNAAVDALIAKTPVLWSDKAESDAYTAAYAALKAAVEAVADFDAAVDTNYNEMVVATRATNFGKIVDRHFKLDGANAGLDALYNENVGKLGNVSFKDWDAIEALDFNINGILATAQIVEGDENYVEFAKENDPIALYKALLAEYREITTKVREIYDEVERLLNDSNAISLAFGNNIVEFLDEITKIMDLGVTDVNLALPGTEENGGATVNLQNLLNNLKTVIAQFRVKADAAVGAADTFATLFATLTNYDATDLNDYDEITNINDELQVWLNTYLAADIADADGDVAAAVAAVQAVQKYLAATGTYYEFLTVTEYTDTVETYAEAVATYAEAKEAWATVLEGLDALTDITMNIHNVTKYDDANAAYVAYVAEYYAGNIEDGVGEFEEITAYTEFTADHNACDAKAAEAAAKAEAIENAIKALPDVINDGNYAQTVTDTKNIYDLIEEYKGYCPELCAECLDRELRKDLAEKATTAALYAYAEAKKGVTGADVAKIDDAIGFYAALIMAVDNGTRDFETVLSTLETTLEFAKSDIDKLVPELEYT